MSAKLDIESLDAAGMPVGRPYDDAVKLTAMGYPVFSGGQWLIAEPTVLDELDLLRMLSRYQSARD